MSRRDDILDYLNRIRMLVDEMHAEPPRAEAGGRESAMPDAAGSAAKTAETGQLRLELETARKSQAGLQEKLDSLNQTLQAVQDDRRDMLSAREEIEQKLSTLDKERGQLAQAVSLLEAERDALQSKVEMASGKVDQLEAEVDELQMDIGGKKLEIGQLQSAMAGLEAQNKRLAGSVDRALGVLLPEYVLAERGGMFQSVFKTFDEGMPREAGNVRRKVAALLFFGILGADLENAQPPLTFESGSQGRRILDTLRSLGESIAQSADNAAQVEKDLEFWAGKILASNPILSEALLIEVPFVGQAFNSAVMMPANPDDFLADVSAVHGWAILTPDRSTSLSKASVS